MHTVYDRRPETGNTHIAETITDRIEILRKNLGFSDHREFEKIKVSASDCVSERQPKIAIWLPKPDPEIEICMFWR